MPRAWIEPKQSKRGLRFGTWNVMSLYRAGSLTIVARELARYKLNFVSVQGVRWDNESTVRAVAYILLRKRK